MRVREKPLKTLKVILASGQVAVKGNHAVVDTPDGLAYALSSVSTTQKPIGRFAENLTGDGVDPNRLAVSRAIFVSKHELPGHRNFQHLIRNIRIDGRLLQNIKDAVLPVIFIVSNIRYQ